MSKFVISLDQGTTSSRAVIFDKNSQVVAISQTEFEQIYPQPGWVEHDPIAIYSTQFGALNEVMAHAGISAEEIAALGITNQRETTIMWNKKTGKPVYNAIVWQCRRTADEAKKLLLDEDFSAYVKKATGLRIDAYFSATKISWILDNVEGARELAEKGDLLFGTVDTWLVWKMTAGKLHITDRTNASRTMLYNINTLEWDSEILKRLNIPASILPKVKKSSEHYGDINIGGVPIPLAGIAGDQQSALFGQTCFEKGNIKNTYGTGCFLLLNTGSEKIQSKYGLITTLAASQDDAPQYVLEGSVFVGGAVMQWLRDEMRFFSEAQDSSYFAKKVDDNDGVYFVPAFTGLGAPYWDMYARGGIMGLTRGTTRNHIIRAALEGIAYQVYDVIYAMKKEVSFEIKSLKVDGGASENEFLMQFQADILNISLERPESPESTALGAAYLAGLAVGFWNNTDEIKKRHNIQKIYTPDMQEEKRKQLVDDWHKAVSRNLDWI